MVRSRDPVPLPPCLSVVLDRAARVAFQLASALVSLAFPVRRKTDLGSVKKILVVGAGGIGDVLMKTPVFDSLRLGFPGAQITLYTSGGPAASVIEGHPGLDRVITIEGREALGAADPGLALRHLRLLRSEKFDMTLTTHYGLSFRGAVFSYLIGAPIRVGFDRGGRGTPYNVRVKVKDPDARHAVEWNLDLVRAVGVEVAGKRLRIALAEADRSFAADLLARGSWGQGQKVISIFPGSKRRSRLWENQRFAEVADALAARYGAGILLLGAESERASVAEISRAMKQRPLIAVGQAPKRTAALIERSSLLVSTDSGPMHMAVAVGTPVVALFGPETPVRVGPFSDRSAVVRHDLPCSPCHDFDCRYGKPECMSLIGVDEVLASVDALLAEGGRGDRSTSGH